ncbi:MAG TPA: glycine cleavage system protein H [Myxococcales bacterium]|jgi:glycine cleavage system H lipoate-binding protein
MPHDFLASYDIKLAEYAIAISFLLCFIPFWRFVNGGKQLEHRASLPKPAVEHEIGFALPEALLFHPGHAWARFEGATALVGMSDFAQKLVGSIQAIKVPAPGERVGQGEKGWALQIDGHDVEMLSPVDGKVVAVNDKVLANPQLAKTDPYGEGWLLKIESQRAAANAKHLLSFKAAKRHIEDAWLELRSRLDPQLGLAMQDGGAPVDGIAKGIDANGWLAIVKKHFLT